MLRFFRKIRQGLLPDNKFSKYLLYAIGEILLVVIGILIALQVSNWNEKMRSDLGHIYLSHYFFSVSKGYNLLKEINLTSLKNKELRISLTRYYENDIPRVHREFADDKLEFENYWLPYVRKHFKEWEFGEYAVPHDYEQIVNDRELLTATKINSINLRNTVMALEAALDSAIKLIELLPDDSILEKT